MNCNEVNELMQRYLDDDLSSEEHETLMHHIRQCTHCTSVYERMKRLSRELEQLPKVTPPFSLVDRILPQLETIEQHRDQQQHSRTWKQWLFSSKSMKVWGGTVAAAVILFVIIKNGLPNVNQQTALNGDANIEIQSSQQMERFSFERQSTVANHSDDLTMKEQENANVSDDIALPSLMESHGHAEPKEQLDASDTLEPQMTMSGQPDEPVARGPVIDEDPKEGTLPQMNMFEFFEGAKEQLSSPNGKYIASIERSGEKQRVVITTAEDQEVTSSSWMSGDDLIFNLEWSHDSTVLEYMIDNGAITERHSLKIVP